MPTSTTLREARRAVAPRMGWFLARTTTSGTVSSLTDTGHPVRSSNIQDDLLTGKWILRPDAGVATDRVRMVAENGYAPATGTIQPDVDWAVPPAAGEVYELHGACEPWEAMNDVLNEALMRCFVVSEIGVVATPGATRHGINEAAPWLQSAAHVRQVGFLYSSESRNVSDPYRRRLYWEAVDDEGEIGVEHGSRTFDAGETLFVRAIKPAYYACRASTAGYFGERSGLAADTHEAPVAGEWLRASALLEFWERYAAQLPEGDPEAMAAERRVERAAADFDTMTAKYLRVPPRNDRPKMTLVGLSARW